MSAPRAPGRDGAALSTGALASGEALSRGDNTPSPSDPAAWAAAQADALAAGRVSFGTSEAATDDVNAGGGAFVGRPGLRGVSDTAAGRSPIGPSASSSRGGSGKSSPKTQRSSMATSVSLERRVHDASTGRGSQHNSLGAASRRGSAGDALLERAASMSEASTSGRMRPRRSMTETSILGLIKPLDINQDGCVRKREFMRMLAVNGLSRDDPRLAKLIKDLDECDDSIEIPRLLRIISQASPTLTQLLVDVLSGNMVIPDFGEFTDIVTEIFEEVKDIEGGKVADYIPALAEVPKDKFAVAITTKSGQRFSLGDSKDFFCLQSVSKIGTYCEALKQHGTEKTHKHVGREPSGENFNAMTLKTVHQPENPERQAIPHNPCINAGAIMCTSLNSPGIKESKRLAKYLEAWTRLCGAPVAFDPTVMVSERESADRNNALAYMMREAGAFESKDVDINETLEFYFSTCAVTCSADMLATAAATLGNSGVNPITTQKVYDSRICKNAMSLMLSCGMYDFSGEWAFTVGLPAKSGVSGIIMIVVPNICGICIWSPPIDGLGNSVKGIEFAKRLVERFSFHHLSSTRFSTSKINPTVSASSRAQRLQLTLMYAASSGDVPTLRQILHTQPDVDFGMGDYDHRTPMHLAATEGHPEVIKFLLEQGAPHSPVDRWGGTPLDDASGGGFANIVALLMEAGATYSSSVSRTTSATPSDRGVAAGAGAATASTTVAEAASEAQAAEPSPRLREARI